MATSPNYGWAEPDNSSLVKNGAQDIRALGDAIDTSLWNVGFGQAGKNYMINADFTINQRNFSTLTTNGYGFDRWALLYGGSGAAVTYSAQTFTAGSAPVAPYESRNFARMATTTGSSSSEYSILQQKIEDVRTTAGKTLTVSFWAKAATGTPKVGIEFNQAFGSGGSSDVSSGGSSVTISTSWARYSATIAVPSVSGKTIGTGSLTEMNLWCSAGSTFNARSGSVGNQTATIDFSNVQVEYGSKATPFQTASGGSPQAELAMCQRYAIPLFRQSGIDCAIVVSRNATTGGEVYYQLPVQMRGVPSATLISGSYGRCVFYDLTFGLTTSNVSAISIGDGGNYAAINILLTHGSVAGTYPTASWDTAVNGGFIMLSAEL